jgi:hypothetical protein
VDIREPTNELDRAVDLAVSGLLAAGSVAVHHPLPYLAWAGRARPCHFFEIGPAHVVGTHYARLEDVGRRIAFDEVTSTLWLDGRRKKEPEASNFEWFLEAGPKVGASVDGPTLAEVVEPAAYLQELRQLLWFAHQGIKERLQGASKKGPGKSR